MAGVEELKTKLRAAIEAVLDEDEPDNPVFRVSKAQVMRDVVAGQPQQYVLERLDRLQQTVSTLVKRVLVSRMPTAAPESPFSLAFTLTPPVSSDNAGEMHKVFRAAVPGIKNSAVRHDETCSRVTLRAEAPIDKNAIAAAASAQGWNVEFVDGSEKKT